MLNFNREYCVQQDKDVSSAVTPVAVDDTDNIMYFDNDDCFADFCLNPNYVIVTVKCNDGVDRMFADYTFTDAYLNAVKCGKRFCVRDLHSHVNKDGYLAYKSATKKIDNVEKYYGDDNLF